MTERDDLEFEWIEPENPPQASGEFSDMRDIWSEVDKHEASFLRKIKWRTLGKMAVWTSAIAGGAYYSHEHGPIIKLTIGSRDESAPIAQIAEEDRTCPPVPAVKLAKIKSLLRSSWNEPLSKILNQPYSEYEYQQYVEAQQEKYGLTPVDGSATQSALELAEDIDEMLNALNKFTMQHYGFNVVLYNSIIGVKNMDADEIKPGSLNINLFRRGAQDLVSAFDFLPLEEVRAVGIKQIRIVNEFEDQSVGAEALVEHGVIDIRLNEFYEEGPTDDITANVYYHEAGHILHYKTCRSWGFDHDPQYLALNPPGFKYGSKEGWQRAAVSEYGGTDLAEDEAEIYEAMLDKLEPSAFHSSYRPVREKYALLLARLDQQVPGMAEYLVSISQHKKQSHP
jgi:hypothetical protein